MSILLTGGAGYIGSHTAVSLLEHGYEVVIADNFSGSSREMIDRIMALTEKNVDLEETDLTDRQAVEHLLSVHAIEAVIHLAGRKAVGESVERPLKYFRNNVAGTLNLLEGMDNHNIKKIVFSSSATVYGKNNMPPFQEEMPLQAVNPYGRTKLMVEEILRDLCAADPDWSAIALRYFNPAGAHESGLLGEDLKGVPDNLMPYITQVACGKRKLLQIFGGDYDTPDGTGMRDYIHVTDLAAGHVKALYKLSSSAGFLVYNLGAGTCCSVLELIRCFEKETGISIPFVIGDRRPGDVAVSFADTKKAQRELGWFANKTPADLCRDAWRYEQTKTTARSKKCHT